MNTRGRVFKYGDNIDTDVIIPARYLNTFDMSELSKHCMEDISPDFADRVQKGDIIVAGRNFGCGSSREHAPLAIKACGVSCLIASGFARIFYRNAINIGLPIIECAEAAEDICENDEVQIFLGDGEIRNLTKGKTYRTQPFPQFIQEIIDAGGLLNSIVKRGL